MPGRIFRRRALPAIPRACAALIVLAILSGCDVAVRHAWVPVSVPL